MNRYRGIFNLKGKVVYLEPSGPVAALIEEYSGALRSGLTYVGAENINTFQEKVRFVRL